MLYKLYIDSLPVCTTVFIHPSSTSFCTALMHVDLDSPVSFVISLIVQQATKSADCLSIKNAIITADEAPERCNTATGRRYHSLDDSRLNLDIFTSLCYNRRRNVCGIPVELLLKMVALRGGFFRKLRLICIWCNFYILETVCKNLFFGGETTIFSPAPFCHTGCSMRRTYIRFFLLFLGAGAAATAAAF